MIPNEIYELACALSEEFGVNFDDAVAAAWRVYRALEAEGLTITAKEDQ